jgi:hypothetical protein
VGNACPLSTEERVGSRKGLTTIVRGAVDAAEGGVVLLERVIVLLLLVVVVAVVVTAVAVAELLVVSTTVASTRLLAATCASNLQGPVAPARSISDTRPATIVDGTTFVETDLALLFKLTFFLDGERSSTVVLVLAVVRASAFETSVTTRVEEGVILVEVVVLFLLLLLLVTVAFVVAAVA